MRYSTLFGKTTRDVSASTMPVGHRFLLQAGYIRESSSGRYFLLPLAMRVRDKICAIIDTAMEECGGQKMISPSLHPLELWEESGRTTDVSFELMKVEDRRGRSFALGGTAEEMIVDVVRSFSVSYRDLPFMLYQFSSKFRDELRARGGLLRTREFMMKDGYSFHQTEADFSNYYELMKETYRQIFENLSIPAHCVAADNGYMGGDYCHEFIVDADCGESDYAITDGTAQAVHLDIAQAQYHHCNPEEDMLTLCVQDAPRGNSIEAGVSFYNQPAWRQIKTIVYIVDDSTPVLVAVRGDRTIHEGKLRKTLQASTLRSATEAEVEGLGSVVGFVSPLSLNCKSIGDYSLRSVTNFYTGADEYQKDTINVNYGRDFEVDILADVTLVNTGDLSNEDGRPYQERRGIEVGNIFQLGTHYSDQMSNATFVNDQGKNIPYYMGCYGIGVDRVLASIAELHHDDKGLCWPEAVAPFHVHLVSLCAPGTEEAESLYRELRDAGLEVLFDDRKVSAGVKFADADLLGIPHRVLISSKTIKAGSVEYKRRTEKEIRQLQVSELLACIDC